jgi:hypothetical protein
MDRSEVQEIQPKVFHQAGNLTNLYLNYNNVNLIGKDTFEGAHNLNQAWAVLRCLVSMIYLDTKKSFPKTENLSRPSIYSLEIYSGTKNFLGLTCDLQTGLSVLGEDLAIS